MEVTGSTSSAPTVLNSERMPTVVNRRIRLQMLSGEPPHSIATFAEALAVQELVEQMLA
jgi:hypothetical protein